MKNMTASLVGIVVFVLLAAPLALAQAGRGEPPGAAPGPTAPPAEMMQQMMPQMMQMLGMKDERKAAPKAEISPAGQLEMMPAMLSGRMALPPETMQAMMDRTFFLDRAAELGLTPPQAARLREIRAACRRDNIRAGAELRIARLELDDLLAGDWTLEGAEKLVRQLRKLEGDMQLRHLRAVQEARQVLTPEQLDKALVGERRGMEELFR